MKVSAGARDAGYASVFFLIVLFLCSTFAMGATAHIASTLLLASREKNKTTVRQEMEDIVNKVIGTLKSDPSPEVNDVGDPVWDWHGKRTGGYSLHITPVSDRINLNYARKNLFDKTRLGLLFRPGKDADKLQQFREDTGLGSETGAFVDFFEEGLLQKYFSSYGWANINLIDEFAARQLGAAITGDMAKGEALQEKIRLLLMERRILDREALPFFLGASLTELFPFVNAEPLMNVNFVDPLILEELLSYGDYGIRRPKEHCAAILSRRETGGINAEDLRSMLDIDRSNPLVHYLGSVTWFWEIAVTAENRDPDAPALRAVLCRLPPGEFPAETKPEYKIIEWRFE
ncbi:MAG: hypothetical protein LBK63_13015 [Treponema sp.]|jgi:hypothetical protein|nr:hypothetical protein [Treponema sp.]